MMKLATYVMQLSHHNFPPSANKKATFPKPKTSSPGSPPTTAFARSDAEAATGTVVIRAGLGFPEQRIGIPPSSSFTLGGYRDANEGYVAAELRKAGFATLTYDSFAARDDGLAAGAPGYLTAGVADAYAALRRLASEPGSTHRIAITGFSFGAEVAHLTAFEALRSALNPDKAGLPRTSPSIPRTYGAIPERGAYTGSPVLMLLGEKDDNLPVAKVESYLAYARAAGNPAPIETVTYPGAYHAWTVPACDCALYPELVSTKKCPLILLGPNRPMVLIDGQAKPFDPEPLRRVHG